MQMNRSSSLIKLGVIALVVLAVAVVWIMKNKAPEPAAPGEADSAMELSAIDLEDLLSQGLPVMLAFGADGCAPCRAMMPALREVYGEMEGKAVIRFIDAWKYTDEVSAYPLKVVPTQIFINADGTPYDPSEGLGVEFLRYTYKETGEPAYTAHEGGLTADQMRAILADMGVAK